MLSKEQFKGMVAKLHDPEDGGFSVDINTGKSPEGGFMVARTGNEVSVDAASITPSHLRDYAQNRQDELSKPSAYFGGWHDRDRGKIDLDVAQHIPDSSAVASKYGDNVAHADARTSALDLSVARNQRAAFDLTTFKDLPNPDFKEPKSGERR